MKFLKIIGKNALAFLAGGVAGILAFFYFVFPQALQKALAEQSAGGAIVGALALVPVLLIIYGALGLAAGGAGGVIVYNVFKIIFKIKKKKQ